MGKQNSSLYFRFKGEYQSGQLGQTVNLLTYVFAGSNPASPTDESVKTLKCGRSSVGRATAFQAVGRQFEPGRPLSFLPM
jgi:hypothetical protein